MNYLANYLNRIKSTGNLELAEAIKKTADDVVPKYISNFSYNEHVISLLVGEIQSGKTSHMFGLMCAAADNSFNIFILLTTDNNLLQEQTCRRARQDLSNFSIYNEDEYVNFINHNFDKPAVVVLKKNARILKRWGDCFNTCRFCKGNPFFIVDDEADAASLNTKINKKKQSTISKYLNEIINISASSIYMQVTGTPMAILLQTYKSNRKPYFIYYFKPGKGYIGGNTLFPFPPEPPMQIVFTDDQEDEEIISDDEFPENCLKTALITHLITSGQIMLTGGDVCNFLIHPSVRIEYHNKFGNKIGCYLNELAHSYKENETVETFRIVYEELKKSFPEILSFNQIYTFIKDKLENTDIKIIILNSLASYSESIRYNAGINIIIGGNTLGRGLTIPQLQTIYYCRVAKHPQADTMWQHARMFGYDRELRLLRIFIPPRLFNIFSQINRSNNIILGQIKTKCNDNNIKIIYAKSLRPTRKNVIDSRHSASYVGGTNYFPLDPINNDLAGLDSLMSGFEGGLYPVSLKLISKILEYNFSNSKYDWDSSEFNNIIKAFLSSKPSAQGKLLVRRERDIGRGTGTLLSPDDRKIGDNYHDEVILTMYKITGNIKKNWDGRKIWIPNIKLPGDQIYYLTFD